MIPSLRVTSSDRILYFAPHPDDESIGGAGIIQHAVKAQAPVRVVFVTNGDRNPWPQRVKERRVRIGASEQQRWGGRRRLEAVSALQRLGLDSESARFFHWPDQGVCSFLLSAEAWAVDAIAEQIREFQPTLLLLPSAEDVHPDHSAFYVLAQLALRRLEEEGISCRHLSYVIHPPSYPIVAPKAALALSGAQVYVKRAAIQLHETQMLSRRRFLAHATSLEKFYLPAAPHTESATHPIRSAQFEGGALRLIIELPAFRGIHGAKVQVALESLTEGAVRWTVPLPYRSARVQVCCAVTGRRGRFATVRMQGRLAEIAIPVWSVQPIRSAYVKIACRPLFYDFAGWHEVAASEATAAAFPTAAPQAAAVEGLSLPRAQASRRRSAR